MSLPSIDPATSVIDVDTTKQKHRLIQLSVYTLTKGGVLLTASDYLTYEVIETGLTFDAAYAREDWLIVSNYWPLENAIPAMSFDNPREHTDRLIALQTEVRALRKELHMSHGERYKVLADPSGPIRQLERQIDTLKMLASVSMHATFGFWPSNIRDHLGI